MTTSERSIEEIVEEFNNKFTVQNKNKKMSSDTVLNELITPKTISNWLTKILQAERQKLTRKPQKLKGKAKNVA